MEFPEAKTFWFILLHVASIIVIGVLYHDVSKRLASLKTTSDAAAHKITKRSEQQPSCIMRCQRGRNCECQAAGQQPLDPPCKSVKGVQRITGVGFGQAPSYPSYEHGWGGQTGVNNVLASAAKQEYVPTTYFIRWGFKGCTLGSEPIYSGFIAGPYVSNLHGGSADLQCVSSRLRGHTQDTERACQNLIANSTDSIIGAVQFDRSTNARTNLDIACSLCFLPEKSTQVMVPGNSTCQYGWTEEYRGYLMSSVRSKDPQYSVFSNQICVDRARRTGYTRTSNSTIKLSYVKLDNNYSIRNTPCVVCSR